MRHFFLLFLVLFSILKLSAQEPYKMKGAIRFISYNGDTVRLYKKDIRLLGLGSFKVTDSSLCRRLKILSLKEIHLFTECCGVERIHLSGVLSSAWPANDLCFFTHSGFMLRFYDGCTLSCTETLLKKIETELH